MTRYEQLMYERDLPGIRQSLERIATILEKMEGVANDMKTIISDPGDEVDPIIDHSSEMNKIWNSKTTNTTDRISDDYVLDMD